MACRTIGREAGEVASSGIRREPLTRLASLGNPRQSLENRLVLTVRLRGGENEFEALRDYQRDDDYRAIDWKATARRQKLITCEYQQERNQSVLCMLDCGRLMTVNRYLRIKAQRLL